MTKWSARRKIRWQGDRALDDLKRTQIHLVQLAALADFKSDYINKNLPDLITTLEVYIVLVERFNEGL
jgi:predicted nucleotide-binding protein (sugar kinase/HSP70/actin superfamily)